MERSRRRMLRARTKRSPAPNAALRVYHTSKTPTTFNAGVQVRRADVQVVCPFRAGHCSAVDGKKDIVSFIVALREAGHPTQIIFFVVQFVINTIKRVLRRWSSANFTKEFWERIKTEFDTTTAIVFIVLIVFIGTTSFRGTIGVVFSGMFIAVGLITFYRHLTLPASARFRVSTFQGIALYDRLRAAFANTVPQGGGFGMVRATGETLNCPTIKRLSSQIFKAESGRDGLRRESVRIIKRHIVSLTDNLARLAGSLQRSCGLFLLYQNSVQI